MIRTITFYKAVNGNCPVEEFLDSLPGKVAQKIVWVLKLIEDLDRIPSSYLKKLPGTEEIWECRVQFGSNIYRIFCFIPHLSEMILTHGYVKKTNKIPIAEIERAEAYRREYLTRR
jgi:phage-related protein